MGLPVPELVLVEVDPDLGRAEPDPEIQELIEASPGLNVGMDFLPGALAFDEAAASRLDPALAAGVVWFDTLVMNVDRTPRNPNLLTWHGRMWLIDHGAAIYLQHGADDLVATADRSFPLAGQHVLLPHAGPIREAAAPLVDCADLDVVDAIPQAWGVEREPYRDWLRARLERWEQIASEAEAARG
jgi:hypothetical protein